MVVQPMKSMSAESLDKVFIHFETAKEDETAN